MTFRNKLTLGFGAALCALLFIGGLSYRTLLDEDSDHKWIAHTQEVLGQLDAALEASTELNDDERAILLCGIRVSATALQQDGSFVIIQFGRRFQGSVQLPEDLLCMRDPLMVRILVQKSSVGKSANE